MRAHADLEPALGNGRAPNRDDAAGRHAARVAIDGRRTPGGLLLLQRSAGNSAVVALVPAFAVQRQVAVPSKEAPGLPENVAIEVTKLLAAKKRQAALDVLVAHLGTTGEIDLSFLEGKKMHYNRAVAGEGLSPEPGYQKDAFGGLVSRPTPVRIAPGAFNKGLSWLYSVVMHEYQHVLQFHDPGAKGTTGQVTIPWLVERQEVEAYAWEVLNASKTGLDQKPKLLKERWRRLHEEHWLKLGPKGRKLMNALYVSAHAEAVKLLPGVKLGFKP
jgi:hypothetical protein